eukprot:TRINITY_DN16619_c0_g1_i1.p1 TRINITY_DN16619_c0_g1~~TRINITY_DN16619_c0_g1_i1.p1  ORF type:complete len:293 (+),score=50.88 TRINITY_DN16619_c0_g1_i1:43-921(+)
MDEDWEDHDWTAKAAGGLRGMMLGLFRVVTRPAQMKVLIWFAKRRWKNKGKVTPAMTPGDLAASVGLECVIGAAMYDVYGRALCRLDAAAQDNKIPGGEYVPVFGAGVAAGVASAVLTTPHNNIVTHHTDTRQGIWRAFTHLGWQHPFKGGLFDGVRHAVVRDSVAVSVMFVSTAWFKKNLPQPQDTLVHNAAHAFLSGGLAGMVSTIAVMPFRNPHMWGTQYPGTYFFMLAPRMLSSPSSTLSAFKVMAAGMPPALLAAFIPNAFGMAAFTVANQLNKELEEVDEPKAKSA